MRRLAAGQLESGGLREGMRLPDHVIQMGRGFGPGIERANRSFAVPRRALRAAGPQKRE